MTASDCVVKSRTKVLLFFTQYLRARSQGPGKPACYGVDFCNIAPLICAGDDNSARLRGEAERFYDIVYEPEAVDWDLLRLSSAGAFDWWIEPLG
jgi:hypothetical protein